METEAYKKYRLSDIGKIARRKSHQEYYAKNKDKCKKAAVKWQLANPEKCREVKRMALRKFIKTPKGMYHTIKQNSRVRKRAFTLDQSDFIKWYENKEKTCHYCSRPQNGNRLEIERLDNNIGYVLSNMSLACHECNRVKGFILTEKEMLIVGEIVMKKRWEK